MAKQGEETEASSQRLSAKGSLTAEKPRTASTDHIFAALQAVLLTILAAVDLPLSRLCLSPVYGSTQAGLYHRSIASALIPLSLLSSRLLRRPYFSPRCIASWAFATPMLHFLLFKLSGTLGTAGPLVTEALTYYPLISASLHAATANLEAFTGATPYLFGPGVLYVLFLLVQKLATEYLPKIIGQSILFTRVGLQTAIAVLYAIVIPNSLPWLAFPSLLFILSANPHTLLPYTTSVLNNTLHHHNYSLLARYESITGYISVLENTALHFRVMRADHSLLGGEWTMPPPAGHQPRVAEPIYAIFTMLEAVRLIETPRPVHVPLSALNIGLGVGTAPSALIAHGINTTILELDPAVYRFAREYFHLPPNHTAHITDAVDWVTHAAQSTTPPQYDFIIHDVFTGGAEPIPLFTHEFLTSMAQLLKDDGAIAINYAGDLKSPAPALVYHTTTTVFPSCAVYRETLPPDPTDLPVVTDFTNLVIFCTKGPQRPTFRPAVETDYLGSGARQEWLQPRREHSVHPDMFGKYDEGQVLRKGSRAVNELAKLQVKSAAGHWRVMRGVIPAVVWENW